MPQTLEDLQLMTNFLSVILTLTRGIFHYLSDRDAGLICAKHFTNVINMRI